VTLAAAMVAIASGMEAQIRVNPTTVDVNSQGPTTVFLTYGFTADYQPAEAVWCRDLISAAPAVGLRCDPTRLWGELPERYNLSRSSGIGGFTDIMSMPASVARRAYQAAAGGATGEVYYVRHFASKVGAPDQFVVVTLRLTGGGARGPLSLTDATMAFAGAGREMISVNPPIPDERGRSYRWGNSPQSLGGSHRSPTSGAAGMSARHQTASAGW